MIKLIRENKIEIYERRLKGKTIHALAKKFNNVESKIKHFIVLIRKHGYTIWEIVKIKFILKILNNKQLIEF